MADTNGNGSKMKINIQSLIQTAAVVLLLGGGGALSVEKVSRDNAASEIRVTKRIEIVEKELKEIKDLIASGQASQAGINERIGRSEKDIEKLFDRTGG